jgi:hypothetical protein
MTTKYNESAGKTFYVVPTQLDLSKKKDRGGFHPALSLRRGEKKQGENR